jgi:hypothetical protein
LSKKALTFLSKYGIIFLGGTLMIISKPRKLAEQELNEMAIAVISSRKDGLPFRITIQIPDHFPPHAHIKDLETGKKELGQFVVSEDPPRRPEDIKDYKQGLTEEMRQAIFEWAKAPHKALPQIKNWDALYLEWSRNEKW